jgi:hypothetical protein
MVRALHIKFRLHASQVRGERRFEDLDRAPRRDDKIVFIVCRSNIFFGFLSNEIEVNLLIFYPMRLKLTSSSTSRDGSENNYFDIGPPGLKF